MDKCNENVIEFLENQERATVTFSQGRFQSRIRKLAAEHPEECNIVAENPDGSLYVYIPTLWIKISPPRQFTEEQRQRMGKRLNGNNSSTVMERGKFD